MLAYPHVWRARLLSNLHVPRRTARRLMLLTGDRHSAPWGGAFDYAERDDVLAQRSSIGDTADRPNSVDFREAYGVLLVPRLS